jgi:PPOX class probable F420-dependent enzyme
MPPPPLPAALDEFLKQPNPSVIATLDLDGSPHSTATWYVWDDGRVLVNMDEGRQRLEYIRNDPRVSITVLGQDSWYYHVTLRGGSPSCARTRSMTSTGSRATTRDSRIPTASVAALAR